MEDVQNSRLRLHICISHQGAFREESWTDSLLDLKKDGQLFTTHSITSSNRMDAYSKCLFLRGFQTPNKEDFMRKIAIKMPLKVTQLEEIQTVVNLHTKSVYSHEVSRRIIKKFLREKSPLRNQ